MYCPNCGQQQLSDNTKFCSRCGIPVSGLAEWVASSGKLAVHEEIAPKVITSPRRRGIRRGVKVVLSSLALSPVFFFFSLVIGAPIPMLIPLTFFLIGLSVMLYSRIFGEETPYLGGRHEESGLKTMFNSSDLPPASNNMTNRVGGQQARTSELVEPPSVTEHTTKLLENDQR
jgi:hypothetical protein